MMQVVALLLGLFVMPAVILWLGHHLRRSTPRERRAFWGGVIGWIAAVCLMLILAMAPPVLWRDGLREAGVHWILLVGGLLGIAVGALRRSS